MNQRTNVRHKPLVQALRKKIWDLEARYAELGQQRNAETKRAEHHYEQSNIQREKLLEEEKRHKATHAALLESQTRIVELEWERDTLFNALRRVLDDSDE